MKKHHFLSLLVLFLIFTSLKSYAVPYPERIEWRAQPKEFVVSLYIGVLNRVQPDQNMINNLASKINSKPSSRLDLFWLFISSNEYKATMYANQKKAYQVYYEYVNSGKSIKHRYYFAKQPSGADRSIKGNYNYGIAAAIRDYHATYDKKSIEFGQLTFLVELGDLFDDYNDNSKGVTDPSGKNYKTVKIGNQIWMAENLAYEIPGKQITDDAQWMNNIASDGWCYYDNDKLANGNTYGILYQWEAAKEACPTGWHLPSDTEWKQLEMSLGMSQSNADGEEWRGTDEGEKLKNSSSFAALPYGRRNGYGNFIYKSILGFWWTSTNTYHRAITFRYPTNDSPILRDNNWSSKSGNSVRCVKD